MRKDSTVSKEAQKELDIRLKNLKIYSSKLFSWDEVKNHLKEIRKVK